MKRNTCFYAFAACALLLTACSKQITAEEAKAIALSHVGLSEDLVTFTSVELDTDDVNHHYDVEFHTANQQEYHYEIDSSNGKVLEWEVEPIYDGEM